MLHIISYIKKNTNYLLYITIGILIIYIIYISYHCAVHEPHPITLDDVLALGPQSLILGEFFVTYQEVIVELGGAMDNYGMIQEDLINHKIRQLILDFPRWLDFYMQFRKNIWGRFEEIRLADNVSLPDYEPQSSPLIMQPLNLQNN